MPRQRVPHQPLPAVDHGADLPTAHKRHLRGRSRKQGPNTHSVLFIIILVVSCLATAALLLLWSWQPEKQPRALTPLNVPRVLDLPQLAGDHKERLFWGTFRPHLYLGVRARSPRTLLAGLMWMGMQDGRYSLRHTCEQSDSLQQYGWVRHDGYSYGRQEIRDGGVAITTWFLKQGRAEGSKGYGGDWAVRIHARLAKEEPELSQRNIPYTVFFYLMDETGRSIKLWPEGRERASYDMSRVFATGQLPETGPWNVLVNVASAEGRVDGLEEMFAGMRTPDTHNLTQLVMDKLLSQAREIQRLELPNTSEPSSNLAVYQLTAFLPFTLDVAFVANASGATAVADRADSLTGSSLTTRLAEREQSVDVRFDDTFQLKGKAGLSPEAVEAARAVLANTLGGMGYFYGRSRIAIPRHLQQPTQHDPTALPYWLYWPAALFTATPSRSFFPRGFLWDEGFHQLLISRWDLNLTLDALAHWLDLINLDGWIPREQILGAEARSKVPEEFILQHTTNANPPTLFLLLRDLAHHLDSRASPTPSSLELPRAFLQTAFPRLKAWFDWYNTSQAGNEPGSYYWHGRDTVTDRELNPKTLMSGLDDYPRASHPNPDERHVDLRCWMALAASSMATIARILGEDGKAYEETAALLTDLENLNNLHLDQITGEYSDYGNHSERVLLEWALTTDPVSRAPISRELRRKVVRAPRMRFVPHFGYNSLFPLLMLLIPPDSAILGHQLAKLEEERLLWTDYGLRSLATNSSMYMKHNTEHDAPYWRGPVWININYLALAALKHYHSVPGPYSAKAGQLYDDLRVNLIRNVVQRYYESGYLWEHYDNTAEGRGKGSHPFTGWTALIVLVMAEAF